MRKGAVRVAARGRHRLWRGVLRAAGFSRRPRSFECGYEKVCPVWDPIGGTRNSGRTGGTKKPGGNLAEPGKEPGGNWRTQHKRNGRFPMTPAAQSLRRFVRSACPLRAGVKERGGRTPEKRSLRGCFVGIGPKKIFSGGVNRLQFMRVCIIIVLSKRVKEAVL